MRWRGLALLLAGCSGSIAGGQEPPGSEPGAPAASVPAASMPASAPAPAPSSAPLPSCAASDPGPTFLRRLTNAEYRQTVLDLLGDGPDRSGALPSDPVVEGFDNNAEAIALSNAHLEKYRDAAEQIAADLVGDVARRARVVGCDPAADRACAGNFATTFARRAFRRPVGADERAALATLATADAGQPWTAIAQVIQGVLLSPNFLFRVEVGRSDPARPEVLKLTGTEIATRLAYLLRGSTPDDALLAAAEQGRLDGADGVAAAAEAMLSDGRARGVMRSFAGQWLGLPMLASVTRDGARYPLWNPALGASMREETMRLVDEHALRPGVHLLDLLVAGHTWIDGPLARVYGRPQPAGWTRAELTTAEGRAGLLTHPAVLTATARNESALAIHRGKFLREQLLCDRLPSPPDDIPQIPAAKAGQNERQRLDAHRKDPACRGCHALLDPLGLGLARFDLIGAARTTDAGGQPVSAEGSLSGFGPAEFDGAPALARLLRSNSRVSGCLVTQLFRFAQGRREQPADACAVQRLAAAFAAGDLRAVLLALVRSDGFRYRRPHANNVRPEEAQP